jgi:hypothetical protein
VFPEKSTYLLANELTPTIRVKCRSDNLSGGRSRVRKVLTAAAISVPVRLFSG